VRVGAAATAIVSAFQLVFSVRSSGRRSRRLADRRKDRRRSSYGDGPSAGRDDRHGRCNGSRTFGCRSLGDGDRGGRGRWLMHGGGRVGVSVQRVLEPAHTGPERFAHLGQSLGSEHEQKQDQQECDVDRIVKSHGVTQLLGWVPMPEAMGCWWEYVWWIARGRPTRSVRPLLLDQ